MNEFSTHEREMRRNSKWWNRPFPRTHTHIAHTTTKPCQKLTEEECESTTYRLLYWMESKYQVSQTKCYVKPNQNRNNCIFCCSLQLMHMMCHDSWVAPVVSVEWYFPKSQWTLCHPTRFADFFCLNSDHWPPRNVWRHFLLRFSLTHSSISSCFWRWWLILVLPSQTHTGAKRCKCVKREAVHVRLFG